MPSAKEKEHSSSAKEKEHSSSAKEKEHSSALHSTHIQHLHQVANRSHHS